MITNHTKPLYNLNLLFPAPLIEIFNGTSFIAMRSMVSKLVCKDELGKIHYYFCILTKITNSTTEWCRPVTKLMSSIAEIRKTWTDDGINKLNIQCIVPIDSGTIAKL